MAFVGSETPCNHVGLIGLFRTISLRQISFACTRTYELYFNFFNTPQKMILIHSHLSTTVTLPIRYCCPVLDNIVQACPALNLAGCCKRTMNGCEYLTVMLMLFNFIFFKT